MLEKELAYRRCIGRPSDAIGLAARDAAELTLSLGKEIQRLDKAEKRRQRCQIRRRRQVESACNPGNAR